MINTLQLRGRQSDYRSNFVSHLRHRDRRLHRKNCRVASRCKFCSLRQTKQQPRPPLTTCPAESQNSSLFAMPAEVWVSQCRGILRARRKLHLLSARGAALHEELWRCFTNWPVAGEARRTSFSFAAFASFAPQITAWPASKAMRVRSSSTHPRRLSTR